MRQPSFAHLTGTAMWRHCDFDRTRLAPAPTRVMLAPIKVAPAAAADPTPWLAARGGAAVVAGPPDLCTEAAVILADPATGLFALAEPPADGEAWRRLAAPRVRILAPPSGALDFAPQPENPAVAPPPLGIARDRAGRVWLLDRTPPRLRVLSTDLSMLDTLALPTTAIPQQVMCCRWGVIVSTESDLLVQPFGGVWRSVPVRPVAIAADADQDFVAVLLPGPQLAILTADNYSVFPLPELTAPVTLLVTGPRTVLVGEPRGAPSAPVETRFVAFDLGPGTGPSAIANYGVRGFDGRGIWRFGDAVYVSTATGSRVLYAREAPVETAGLVESYALDSAVFACVWHRVFVDACVPSGTTIAIEAKTADDLPPLPLRRPPRPPADIAVPVVPVAADDPWPPLGSVIVDEPGWTPVGILDTRGAMADVSDPPERIIRPSGEPFAAARSTTEPPWPSVTLEGLITTPPGRYLWLRLILSGTERRSPAVFAIRASYQRPSLLDLLPSYWRADPVAADATDRALALFEGWTTELDARVTLLRQLADPRLVPPEALEWLASYVAITFDQRLDEAVRRQLLVEASRLFQNRGTVPGLERLISILARAPAIIVENFRLRRQAQVTLGAQGAVIGPGLQLGDDEGNSPVDDPVDLALVTDYAALLIRRAAIRAAGGTPCPPDDPPYPVESDPLAKFVRRFAHRFTVVLPCPRTDTLEAVLEQAIEANKPAHTLHTLCWLDAGYQIGRSSLVGLARLGDTPCFEPGLLGAAVLGAANTLGRYEPDTRFRPGQRLRHERMATP